MRVPPSRYGNGLSPRQFVVLKGCNDFLAAYGRNPTVTELAKFLGEPYSKSFVIVKSLHLKHYVLYRDGQVTILKDISGKPIQAQ